MKEEHFHFANRVLCSRLSPLLSATIQPSQSNTGATQGPPAHPRPQPGAQEEARALFCLCARIKVPEHTPRLKGAGQVQRMSRKEQA